MITEAQTALTLGMRTLTRSVGELFVFSGHSFPATVSEPLQVALGFARGTTPGAEFDLEIEAEIGDVGPVLPRDGQTLTRNGVSYRIVGVMNPPGSHKVVFLVYQPK